MKINSHITMLTDLLRVAEKIQFTQNIQLSYYARTKNNARPKHSDFLQARLGFMLFSSKVKIATKRYSEDANCPTALTGTILTI